MGRADLRRVENVRDRLILIDRHDMNPGNAVDSLHLLDEFATDFPALRLFVAGARKPSP